MTDTEEEAGPVPAADAIVGPEDGGPNPDEVKRLTDAIIDSCGDVDLETALTAICNLAGQLVAALAEGNPTNIKMHSDSVCFHIRKVATAKMLYDDQKAREAEVLDADS